MAASNVASALPACVNSAMSPADSGISPFEPSVWGEFFANYSNPISKESQERMRERAHQLQGEVGRRIFEAGKANSTVNMAELVDTIEHLGVDHCFRDEIAAAMRRICSEELEFSSSDDLHVVALRFGLLRQHGIWVSADVFDKFKDSNGNFSTNLCKNPRGLLTLYNAAHMAIPGEKTLDDAIAFSRRHLEAMKGKLQSPLAEQVSRALGIPLHRIGRPVENMDFIADYEQEAAHDVTLLELAKLDFELRRCCYLEELRELTLWWRELCNDVKLPYTRDRVVENFFWTCEAAPEEENSRSRKIFSRVFGLMSLMDDTYDVHATYEESRRFTEAIQRWDLSAVSEVPEYLRRLYIRTLEGFQKFDDMLEPNEKYAMHYVIKAYKRLSELYFQEVTWENQRYNPSLDEHIRVSAISSGVPALVSVLMMGFSGDSAPTRADFEWFQSMPDMVVACGQVGRFINDMAAYTLGKNKKDVANTHECYMKEFGVTEEEAFLAIKAMAEHAWRTVNKGCLEMADNTTAARKTVHAIVVDLVRSMELIYLGGKRDAYTYGSTDLITSLYLKPVISA